MNVLNGKINKILIANRGEIAIRIIRACKELGISTVAVFSEADKDSTHVKLADESICIGPASPKESYLNIVNILSAAKSLNVDAIHPGFGFLSENSKFAKICAQSNIIFIGPTSDTIALMGNKAVARQTMKQNNIPIIEGYEDEISTLEEGKAIAKQIGYPIMLKAALGGGGKGIRLVENEAKFEQAYYEALSEANTCFGNSKLYIEKYIRNAKHIEFQILADHYGHIVHLGERECSLQRKNQKILEEAPSTFLTPSLREEMGETAKKVAQIVSYTNAGTVEFLIDENGHYYFMEVNTRIQVEHAITEMITNIDLVKEQINISAGMPLSFTQSHIQLRGHAIECRINAEDPKCHFMPSCGKVEHLWLPGGLGIRIETHLYQGYTIPHFYDSMVGKIISHGKDRADAIVKMKRALDELSISGITTNVIYLQWLLEQEQFIQGNYTTQFLSQTCFI